MTPDERGAFERAWWPSLFRLDVGAADGDDEVADEPVDVLSVNDEDGIGLGDRRGVEPDVLLYFLTDAEIDAIARLEASPAPRQLRRAFLVRQALP